MTMRRAPDAAWIATALALIASLIATIALPLLRPQPEDSQLPSDGNSPVVVVGFSGVIWENVTPETAPALYDFAQSAASANMVVKTLGVSTCPNAGWLTISSGSRTTDRGGTGCGNPALVDDDGIAQWDTWLEANESNRYAPELGLLGDYLAEQGVSVASVGPGGAIALADSAGKPVGEHVEITMADGLATDVATAYEQVADTPLVVVDLGSVRHPDWPLGEEGDAAEGVSAIGAAFSAPDPAPQEQLDQIAELDSELADLLAAIDSNTSVILLSLADAGDDSARLQLFAMSGPGVGNVESGALANTHSTRQPGLVQLTDVHTTLLSILGVPPTEPATPGSLIWAADDHEQGADRIAGLVDAEERAASVRPAVGPFYIMLVLMSVAFIIVSLVRLRRPSAALGSRGQMMALAIAGLPVASLLANLLPWWRVDLSTVAFLALCLVIATGLALAAMSLRRFSPLAPAGMIALVTAGVLALDAIFGSALHASSVLGDQPQSGGRFYGLSNAPFVLFAVSMIFLTVLAIRVLKTWNARFAAPAAVVIMAAIAIIIDGSPRIGADFGGPPALGIAFVVLLFLVLGKSLTPKALIIVAIAALALTLGISFLDFLRPADSRTHLGDFFQSLVDGNAFVVLARKIELFATSVPRPVWIVAGAMAIGGFAWWRSQDRNSENYVSLQQRLGLTGRNLEELRWGAITATVLVVAGFFINDSGLVLPLIGIVYGVPLWLAAADSR